MNRSCIIETATPFYCYRKVFLVALLCSSMVIESTSNLLNRWSLPDEPTSFEYSNQESAPGFNFKFEFPVSRDVATKDNIAVSLYDQGCKYNDGEPPVELLDGISEQLVFPPSMASSTVQTVTTGLEVTLGNNGMDVASLIQKYPSLWEKEKSQFSFCVRFSLVTESIEVNFVETIVILDVILDGISFQIKKVNVNPKEKIESIQQVSYSVNAYLCDGRYRPLREENTGVVDLLYEVCEPETGETQTFSRTNNNNIDSSVTRGSQAYEQQLSEAQKVEQEKVIYRQGSVVRVCIRPDDTALGEVSMRTIEELVFEGTVDPSIANNMRNHPPTTFVNAEQGIYTQVAVQNGSTKPSNDLSVMSCESNRLEGRPEVVVCAIDTILVADFYWRAHGNVAVVKALGNAILQFGSPDQDIAKSKGKRFRRAEVVGNTIPIHDLERSLEDVPLDTFWNMTRPKVDFPGERFDFRMNYTVSDAISSDMVQLEIWEKSCQRGGKEPKLEYSFDKESPSDLLEMTLTDANETGEGWGSQIVTINGHWKREESGFASMLVESPYYKETSDQSLVQISLCARYQLHTKPELGNTEVNFLESPIIINIDMSAKIKFGVAFELITDEDPCLGELDLELRTLSGGMDGADDLFMSDIYWRPSIYSSDSTMSMGPSTLGSPSSNGEASDSMSSTNQITSRRPSGSSTNTPIQSWMITTTIAIFTFALLSCAWQ